MLEAEAKTRLLQLEAENAEIRKSLSTALKRLDSLEEIMTYLLDTIKGLKGQLGKGPRVRSALSQAVAEDVLNPTPFNCGDPDCNGRGANILKGWLPCRSEHLEYEEKKKRADRLNAEMQATADRRVKAAARKAEKEAERNQ